jgi:hypothetical protein
VVDQRDAGLEQDQRPEVRVPPARRARCVHDTGDTRLHERLRRDAVDVLVVDHRDVPGLQTLREPLRPAVDASDADAAPPP